MLQVMYVVQVAIGCTFAVAAIAKVIAPNRFFQMLAARQIVPRGLTVHSGVALIVAEVAIALGHVTGWHVILAEVLACASLVAFGYTSVQALRAGRITPCLCFDAGAGGAAEIVDTRTLARICVLFVGECLLLLQTRRLEAMQVVGNARDCAAVVVWVSLLIVWGRGVIDALNVGLSRIQNRAAPVD